VSNYEPLINNKVNIAPGWWTYMTMARCYFADLLPNENKIIYLDLDVMIE
jgi:lipopolysaccharide biosynthesis glycosyltransferase